MDKNNMKSLVINDDVSDYLKSCDKSKNLFNVTIPEEVTSPKDEETNVCTKEKKNSSHTLNSKLSLFPCNKRAHYIIWSRLREVTINLIFLLSG